MMKKDLLIAALAGFVALILAAVATASLSVIPGVHLRLVERVVCPSGQNLEYRELEQFTYTDAAGTHTQARVSISCVSSDGTITTGTGTAVISALLGLYFVIFCVPLLAAGLLYRRSLLRPKPGAAPSPSR